MAKLYRVIFHLDENNEEKVNEVFNNLRNLLADLGVDNVDVEMLVNGSGVIAMRKDNVANGLRISRLSGQGVRFVVCSNSLRNLQISEDDIALQAEIVPAGVSELVRKQSSGWAYIRP